MTKTEELLKLVEAVYSPFKDDWERLQAEKLLCVAVPQTIKQLVELTRLQHDALIQMEDYEVLPGEWDTAVEAFEKFERGG